MGAVGFCLAGGCVPVGGGVPGVGLRSRWGQRSHGDSLQHAQPPLVSFRGAERSRNLRPGAPAKRVPVA